jgi:Fe-S-cluster-containing hydrogenase component 2
MKKLKTILNRCTGCSICELFCSFHFTKAFSRKAGAIEVCRDEAEGKFEPIIHQAPTSFRKNCDLCEGEEQYLCIKYCPVEAIEVAGGTEYGEK